MTRLATSPSNRSERGGVVTMKWAMPRRLGSKLAERLPMGLALSTVTAVWLLGCVWSFTEQTAFARAKGFADPELLPLVIDGLAVSMAAVAFAASLDGRPALAARLGTALAVLASAASNGLWAAERSSAGPTGPDLATVVVGAGIPIAANIAFEVLLAELRRQVQRRRGLPAPAPLPTLRAARLLLAPPSTFKAWRDEVLRVTAAAAPPLAPESGGVTPSDGPPDPDGQGSRDVEDAPAEHREPAAGYSPLTPDPVPAPPAPVPSPLVTFDLPGAAGAAAASGESTPAGSEGPASGSESRDPDDDTVEGDLGTPAGAQVTADREPDTDAGEGSEAGRKGSEANPKVWRLADYLRESGVDPDSVTGELVVELGLCRSSRNGRRLAGRAASLCAALASPHPPPRPDLSGVPRLLLPGEAPTLALVAREESR